MLKAINQAALDNGDWEVANCLLPGDDVCSRQGFAVGEAELERIVGYQEAMRKLKAKKNFASSGRADDGDEKTGAKEKDKAKKK